MFADGSQEWVTAGEKAGAIAFVRRLGDKAVFVTANLTPKPMAFTPFDPESGVKIDPKKAPMLAEGFTSDVGGVVRLAPYGFVAIEL